MIKNGAESVEVTIQTTPRLRAKVYHGKEFIGTTPFTVRLPKNTAPLDLTVKSGGYITVNTRIYTHQDDRLNIKFTPIDKAYTIFGYRKKIDKEKQKEKEENQEK